MHVLEFICLFKRDNLEIFVFKVCKASKKCLKRQTEYASYNESVTK